MRPYMLSCEWCGELFNEEELDADGVCPSCRDPSLAEFERSYRQYRSTYDYRASLGADADPADDLQTCPRCGNTVDRLLGVTGRGGTRSVCVDCRSDALSSDRSFWRWYWRE